MKYILVCTLIFTTKIIALSAGATEIPLLPSDDLTIVPSTTFRQPEEQEVTLNTDNDYNIEDSTTLVFTSDNSNSDSQLQDDPLSETKTSSSTTATTIKGIAPLLKKNNKKEEKELELSQISTEEPMTISIPTSTVSLKTLTQRQDDVVKELNDIWNYSASLNDTTHKELKTTLSSVVELAYARVLTEPDDTLDRLMYLLQKLRQRITVSEVEDGEQSSPERKGHQMNISITQDQSSSKSLSESQLVYVDKQNQTVDHNDSGRNLDASGRSTTTASQSQSERLRQRRKRSYGLGTGIGEIESVPITSHENSLISNYNHDWFNNNNNDNNNNKDGSSSGSHYNVIHHDNSDNYSYNDDEEETVFPTATPSEKTVHKVILVEDKTKSPITFNTKEKIPSPFFYLKSTTLTPLKSTVPSAASPNFYQPIKLSHQNKFKQENQKKRPRPPYARPHTVIITTRPPAQYNTNHNKNNKNRNELKTKNKIPYYGGSQQPSGQASDSETLDNVLISNQNNDPISVNTIAQAIVKLLYPAMQTNNGVTSVNIQPVTEPDTDSNEIDSPSEDEPDNSIPNLKDKMQLLLTLSTAPTGAGKPRPQKLSMNSMSYHLSTTKPGLYPTYLQVHPLPSLSQYDNNDNQHLNQGSGMHIRYPPALEHLINRLKLNQSLSNLNYINYSPPMNSDSQMYLETATNFPTKHQGQEQQDLTTINNLDTSYHEEPTTTTVQPPSETSVVTSTSESEPTYSLDMSSSSTTRSLNLTFPPIMINNNSYTYYYPQPPEPVTAPTTTTTTTLPPRIEPTFPSLIPSIPNMTTTTMAPRPSQNQMMQMMSELHQVHQLPSAVINGTREGLVQFISVLSLLSFSTKVILLFALAVSVLSILLGVYSVAPPIVAIGILGIMIPIAILLLLQDSSRNRNRRRYRNPHGKISIYDLRDEFLLTIDLIERAIEKFKKQHKIKRKKNKWFYKN